MLYQGKNENNEIAQMWQVFSPRIREVKHKTGSWAAYGVCKDTGPDGEFEYVAGVDVDMVSETPEGMVCWEVPEQKYAVFTCTLPTLSEAYQYASKTWLPQSGYERAKGPDFECYDEKFDPNVPESEFDIYIPIK